MFVLFIAVELCLYRQLIFHKEVYISKINSSMMSHECVTMHFSGVAWGGECLLQLSNIVGQITKFLLNKMVSLSQCYQL